MSDRLSEICEMKLTEVRNRKINFTLSDLEAQIAEQESPRGFHKALAARYASGHAALITEIKKASPSAGLICEEFDPVSLAIAYEQGGSACLSVLTDQPFFQGSIDDFMSARAATCLPMLRKDFMIDVWQIAESRALGADCILIIMAAVSDSQAQEMAEAAHRYGMDILIETHDRQEIERALKLPIGMIGINNRNLKTMKTDLQTTIDLSPHVPSDRFLVSESGIRSAQDIQLLSKHGACAFLVGEHLMRQSNLVQATKALCCPVSP